MIKINACLININIKSGFIVKDYLKLFAFFFLFFLIFLFLDDEIKYTLRSFKQTYYDSVCTLLIIERPEFVRLTPVDFKKCMKAHNVIDGRILYDYNEFNKDLPF